MCEPQACDYSSLPKSSTEWTKETLDLLNAKFDSQSVAEFTFPELELPERLQNGMFDSIDQSMLIVVINRMAEELAHFNNSEPLAPYFHINLTDAQANKDPWLQFMMFYFHLSDLLPDECPDSPPTKNLPSESTTPTNSQQFSPSPEPGCSFFDIERQAIGVATEFLNRTFTMVQYEIREGAWFTKDFMFSNTPFSSSVKLLMVFRKRNLMLALGPPERPTTVEVTADGGQAIYPITDYGSRYAMIYVDVILCFLSNANMRPNQDASRDKIRRPFIKCMQLKFMQRCWLNFVENVFTILAQTVSKR